MTVLGGGAKLVVHFFGRCEAFFRHFAQRTQDAIARLTRAFRQVQAVGDQLRQVGARNRAERAFALGDCELAVGYEDGLVALPELASSVIATRKGEHDIALGNVLGSNLFNTLAVVGIAGVIHPLNVGLEVLNRDMLVMAALTLSLFIIGYGFRRPGRINRIEGAVLLACYVGYTAYLINTVFGHQS